MTTVANTPGGDNHLEGPVSGPLESPTTPGGLAKTNARRTLGLFAVIGAATQTKIYDLRRFVGRREVEPKPDKVG